MEKDTTPIQVKTFTTNDTTDQPETVWSEETCRLLKDITVSSVAVNGAVKNLLSKIKSSALEMDGGSSFLALRNILMVEYLLNLSQLISTKVSGQSLLGSPAIERIVEVRTYLEKMKPMHLKLKYQIEKAIKAASEKSRESSSNNNPENILSLRPRLEDIQLDDEVKGEKEQEDDASDDESVGDLGQKKMQNSNKYVPPKVASVPYEEDDTSENRKKRQLERAKRHALNSNLMRELMDEFDEVPEEIQELSIGRKKTDRAAAERTRYEEEYFLRLGSTKEKKKKQQQQSALMTIGDLGSTVTRFDDVSALDRSVGDDDSMDIGKKRKKTLSSRKKPLTSKRKKVIPKRILMKQRKGFKKAL